mmetsp:Transcript_77632/g.121214  ORF Transcript_77632/g.121214 Transcript_77632/m.121214 type:complete len:117 (-) Transcript_77632:5-355(-)
MDRSDGNGNCVSMPTAEEQDQLASDLYHEVESQWRAIRDCESALEAPWANDLLVDARNDPRCTCLEGSSLEAFAINGTAAGEGVFFFPTVLNESQQRALLRTTLGEWAHPPNRNNL